MLRVGNWLVDYREAWVRSVRDGGTATELAAQLLKLETALSAVFFCKSWHGSAGNMYDGHVLTSEKAARQFQLVENYTRSRASVASFLKPPKPPKKKRDRRKKSVRRTAIPYASPEFCSDRIEFTDSMRNRRVSRTQSQNRRL